MFPSGAFVFCIFCVFYTVRSIFLVHVYHVIRLKVIFFLLVGKLRTYHFVIHKIFENPSIPSITGCIIFVRIQNKFILLI